MSTPHSLDKTATWWGTDPADGKIHCYLHHHRLCDSHEDLSVEPIITAHDRPTCGRCIERINTAIHEQRPAHYGAR